MVNVLDAINKFSSSFSDEKDDLFDEAVKVIVQYDRVSASLLQRRLSIGYARAARLVDQLTEAGITSYSEGSKPREVLIHSYEEYKEMEKNPKVIKKQIVEESDFIIPKYKLPDYTILTEPKQLSWGISLKKTLENFKKPNPLTIPLGYDADGKLVTENLMNLRNLIVTGNAMSEKMCFIDTLLTSFLISGTHENFRLIIIDPTHYLDLYEGLPHLLSPIISDNERAFSALKWVIMEVQRRIKTCTSIGVRSIEEYNDRSGYELFPRIVFLVNRISDFISYPKEFSEGLDLIASSGYSSGVQLILVSDRLSEKDIPSSIKSNIPSRIVFATTNASDSKLTEVKGAETLKKGELLFKNYQDQTVNKLNAVYTSEENVKEIVKYIVRIVATSKE